MACQWDILAVDEYDDQVVFPAINLCQSYKVILVCKEQGCWADVE